MKTFAACTIALAVGDFASAFTAPLAARSGVARAASSSVCMSMADEVGVGVQSSERQRPINIKQTGRQTCVVQGQCAADWQATHTRARSVRLLLLLLLFSFVRLGSLRLGGKGCVLSVGYLHEQEQQQQ